MNPDDIPLRDLHLPDMTGWWPLAPGWWVLLGILLIGMIVLIRRQHRRWRVMAPKRFALKQLAAIGRDFERGADAVVLGKELSELTRRAMLAYAPRDEVAGLVGDDWLQWLDYGLVDKPFTRGAGRILESLPYMDPRKIDNDLDVRGLIDTVRMRLRRPIREVSA